MTNNVFRGTLNLAQSINQWCFFASVLPVAGIDERWYGSSTVLYKDADETGVLANRRS